MNSPRRRWLIIGLAVAAVGVAAWLARPRFGPAPPSVVLRRAPTDEQLAAAKERAAASPEDPLSQLQLGNLHFLRGEDEEALAPLQMAAAHPVTAAPASSLLADWARRTRRYAIALPALQNAVSVGSAQADTWEAFVRTLYGAGESASARTTLDEALRRFPDHARLHFILAEVQANAGDARSAAHTYLDVLQDHPDKDAQLMVAMLLARMSVLEEAYTAFKKAVELDPGSLPAYLGLAKTSLDLGLIQEAEDYAYTALQVGPQDPEAIYVLGRVLLEKGGQGERKTAMELLSRTLEVRPGHLEAQYWLGVGHLRANEARPAAQHFQSVLESDPRRRDARQNYAKALRLLGDTKAADEQSRAAEELARIEQRRSQLSSRIDRAPEDPELRCGLADFYAEHGAYPPAIRLYRRALELAPGHKRALEGLRQAQAATP